MSDEPTETLAFDCELPQPPEQVWRALTEPELLAAWLLPNDFRPIEGHVFTFQEPDKEPIECTVLDLDEERSLRLRWRESEQGEALESVVTFTLTPAVGGGTHLRLVHSGLPARLREALPALACAFDGSARQLAALIAVYEHVIGREVLASELVPEFAPVIEPANAPERSFPIEFAPVIEPANAPERSFPIEFERAVEAPKLGPSELAWPGWRAA